MLTSADKKFLFETFVTKADLKAELSNYPTKANLKAELSKYLTREEFINRFGIIMGELKAIREEQVVGNYHRSETYDALENHEIRLPTK